MICIYFNYFITLKNKMQHLKAENVFQIEKLVKIHSICLKKLVYSERFDVKQRKT